jgi:hypothetical protein
MYGVCPFSNATLTSAPPVLHICLESFLKAVDSRHYLLCHEEVSHHPADNAHKLLRNVKNTRPLISVVNFDPPFFNVVTLADLDDGLAADLTSCSCAVHKFLQIHRTPFLLFESVGTQFRRVNLIAV